MKKANSLQIKITFLTTFIFTIFSNTNLFSMHVETKQEKIIITFTEEIHPISPAKEKKGFLKKICRKKCWHKILKPYAYYITRQWLNPTQKLLNNCTKSINNCTESCISIEWPFFVILGQLFAPTFSNIGSSSYRKNKCV